jgi:hypothetical protein
VTQATVTGYKSGRAAFLPSGPVTVVLRGKTAAHLGQVLNSLPKGGTMECMENVLLYNITFALSDSHKTIDVAGYACVAAVRVTQDGKTTLRTDSHRSLLTAVRKVLPAGAEDCNFNLTDPGAGHDPDPGDVSGDDVGGVAVEAGAARS